ncbi:Type II secretory pathway, component PulJ [Serratia quinivorans]|nr:Type II secretory pathway, component PulJ [Serratia quinivorans]
MLISRAGGEAVGSCVIVAYDITRSGALGNSWADAGYFGYRLRQGMLEGQRGVRHCMALAGSVCWINDEVRIEAFSIKVNAGEGGKRWVTLTLSGRSKADGGIRRSLQWAVNMASLP